MFLSNVKWTQTCPSPTADQFYGNVQKSHTSHRDHLLTRTSSKHLKFSSSMIMNSGNVYQLLNKLVRGDPSLVGDQAMYFIRFRHFDESFSIHHHLVISGSTGKHLRPLDSNPRTCGYGIS